MPTRLGSRVKNARRTHAEGKSTVQPTVNGILISQKIKDYRRRHALSQEAFGALLGVSAQAVCKWERDLCYPDITFLPTLARLLECRIDDLFG